MSADRPDDATLQQSPPQHSALDHWETPPPVVAVDAASAPQVAHDLAFKQALAAGRLEGLRAGRAEVAAEAARMKALADSYANALDQLDFRLADMLLQLALDVARQVIVGELAVHPERILDVVKLALNQMAETTRDARLLLNPADATLIRPHLEQIIDKNRLRVVEDARIVRGGCLIETQQGDLDATLQARWRQVVQVLGSNRGWIE
jgi:flagellar assembly protein FliH